MTKPPQRTIGGYECHDLAEAFPLMVLFDCVSVATVYRKKEEADEDDGRPSGWLEATGTLTVGAYGIARIAP